MLVFPSATTELNRQAAHATGLLLQLALKRNIDRDVFVLAMADVLAVVAAQLDREQPMALTDRMDAFTARVRETYARQRR